MRKKVFISYKYDDDSDYKNQLLAWSDQCDIEFTFSDTLMHASIHSNQADYIKQKIREKIESAPYFLCIVGANTWKSRWVDWEINTAIGLKIKIVAVKTDNTNRTPDGLCNTAVNWAQNFKFDSILKTIEEA